MAAIPDRADFRGTNILFTYNVNNDTEETSFYSKVKEAIKKIPALSKIYKGSFMTEEFGDEKSRRHFHVGLGLSQRMEGYIKKARMTIELDGKSYPADVKEKINGEVTTKAILSYAAKGRFIDSDGEELYDVDKKDCTGNNPNGSTIRKQVFEYILANDLEKMKYILSNQIVCQQTIEQLTRAVRMYKELQLVKQYEWIPITYTDPIWENPFHIEFNPVTEEVKIYDEQGNTELVNGARGLWVVGPTGSGKSKGITKFNRDREGERPNHYTYPNDHWFEKPYKGEQIILVDDMNPQLFETPTKLRSTMEDTQFRRKNSSLFIDSSKVIWVVCANVTPRVMWPNAAPDEIDAIERNLIVLELVTPKFIQRKRETYGGRGKARKMNGNIIPKPVEIQTEQPKAGRSYWEGVQKYQRVEDYEDTPAKKLKVTEFGLTQEEMEENMKNFFG